MSVRAKIVDSAVVRGGCSLGFPSPRMLGSVRFGGGDSFAKLSAQTNRNESQMNITQVQLNGHK